MHELGIVVHISKTLEELAQENNITDIRRVTLQIGKVSGIIDRKSTRLNSSHRT